MIEPKAAKCIPEVGSREKGWPLFLIVVIPVVLTLSLVAVAALHGRQSSDVWTLAYGYDTPPIFINHPWGGILVAHIQDSCEDAEQGTIPGQPITAVPADYESGEAEVRNCTEPALPAALSGEENANGAFGLGIEPGLSKDASDLGDVASPPESVQIATGNLHQSGENREIFGALPSASRRSFNDAISGTESGELRIAGTTDPASKEAFYPWFPDLLEWSDAEHQEVHPLRYW